MVAIMQNASEDSGSVGEAVLWKLMACAVENSATIDAPPAEVWRALTGSRFDEAVDSEPGNGDRDHH